MNDSNDLKQEDLLTLLENMQAELEEKLLADYEADATRVELRDDHAIKAAYDEVSALLQKLAIPFTEGK